MHLFIYSLIYLFSEGSLEVKLPTVWTDEKQSRAEAERRERLEERRSEKRKSQKKEDADARKGRKVAKHCVFSMYCGSGGSKSRLAKAAGADIWGDEKWKVARRCGAKQICKSKCTNTPCSDHFWKLRCRKSERRCGAKQISKPNMYKALHVCRFVWHAQKIVHLVQSEQNVRVLQHFQERWQAWGM